MDAKSGCSTEPFHHAYKTRMLLSTCALVQVKKNVKVLPLPARSWALTQTMPHPSQSRSGATGRTCATATAWRRCPRRGTDHRAACFEQGLRLSFVPVQACKPCLASHVHSLQTLFGKPCAQCAHDPALQRPALFLLQHASLIVSDRALLQSGCDFYKQLNDTQAWSAGNFEREAAADVLRQRALRGPSARP